MVAAPVLLGPEVHLIPHPEDDQTVTVVEVVAVSANDGSTAHQHFATVRRETAQCYRLAGILLKVVAHHGAPFPIIGKVPQGVRSLLIRIFQTAMGHGMLHIV